MTDKDRKKAGWEVAPQLKTDGSCSPPFDSGPDLHSISSDDESGSSEANGVTSDGENTKDNPQESDTQDNSSDAHEHPTPSPLAGSSTHSQPRSLALRNGNNLSRSIRQSTSYTLSPATPKPEDNQQVLDLGLARLRTVESIMDPSILKKIFPHLSATEIEHGVQIYEKSLDDAYRSGSGRVSTAQNYDEFQKEAGGRHGQNNPSKQ